MFAAKNNNAITTAISKSMDFNYTLPKEFQEHAIKKTTKKNLGNFIVRQTQEKNTLLKTARRVSALFLTKAKSE